MAKEYKFMFDRRFDEPEDIPPPVRENLSAKSVDGIPSISELLDTLNRQNAEAPEPETRESQETEEPEKAETPQTEQTPIAETERSLPDTGEIASSPVNDENEHPAENELQDTLSETVVMTQDDTFSPPVEETVTEDVFEPVVEPVAEAPAQPAEPVFTQTELENALQQAREESYQKGLEEGRETAWQEAMSSIEKQNSDLLGMIDASLKEILKSSENASQTAFTTAVDFAMAVCRKALPALSLKNAVGEIQGLLEKNFHFLKDEPKISLRLNPFLADKVKPVLADLVKKESYAGKIVVVRDDALPVGDCRVEWKNGGLERNVQDIVKQTEELVNLYAQAVSESEPADRKTGEP